MPLKIEGIKLEGTAFDGRAKLSPDQREAIKVLSREGYSQRKLAIMFDVSRRLIQSIIKPPVRKPAKKRTKEYWTELKRKHRERKKNLYREGKIKFTKSKAK
jgi:transposase